MGERLKDDSELCNYNYSILSYRGSFIQKEMLYFFHKKNSKIL